MKKIILADIKNDFASYQKIIDLYYDNKNNFFEDIELELKGWFSAHTCSMLGGILFKLEDDWTSVKIKHYPNILLKNNFLSFYGESMHADTYGTTIPYEILSPKDDRHFAEYVEGNILG